ncbi:unnamed protein product, partial [Gulo gulo]
APEPVQQHERLARDLFLHHQVQGRDPDSPGEGRAGAAAAAPEQAGAGGGHDGPEQLRPLAVTAQRELSERARMGGLCPAARAGRPQRQPRPQLCLCQGAWGRACGPASSWLSTSSSYLARAPVLRGVGGRACSTSHAQSCSPQGGWGEPWCDQGLLGRRG